MIKILFICYGNICRSPMAEYLLKDIVRKKGLQDEFEIASAATSTEEIWGEEGNPVHPGTKKKLAEAGISCEEKRAVQVTRQDYNYYDYLICMDSMNVRDLKRICGTDRQQKIYRLMEFTDEKRDVADPWYTRNFDKTYDDICKGLNGFLLYLKKKKII